MPEVTYRKSITTYHYTTLTNPAVRQENGTTHTSTDGVLKDFCDGNFFRNHGVFSMYPDALQFIMYYDEIEVANPLGAKAGKHKLGMPMSYSVYVTLYNVHVHVHVCQLQVCFITHWGIFGLCFVRAFKQYN